MKLILVSGFSGSGKSVALKTLEDAGYFAVDNLPAALVISLLTELHALPKIAIAIDVRIGESVAALPSLINQLRENTAIDCRLLFIEANDNSIAKRFAETRRPHPLADRVPGGVAACINKERLLLAEVVEMGHRMDTSNATANTLRAWVNDWLALDRSQLCLTFLSFGFKHGIALDADFVFDARFLPNPYYDVALRPLSGRDDPVQAFLQADLNVGHFVDDIASFILRWLPQFSSDNRAALTIAVGCTGGQHRSVFIVEALSQRFGNSAGANAANQPQVLLRHRDLI